MEKLNEQLDKWWHVIILISQILLLILLLLSLNTSGMALLLGEGFGKISSVVIQFGVIIMAMFASIFSSFLPTREHRTLRDTQIQIFKYMGILGLFQLLAFMLSNVAGSMGIGGSDMNPMLMTAMVMIYCMTAFMIPFNYVKNLFNIMKSVEQRNPNRIIREYFR